MHSSFARTLQELAQGFDLLQAWYVHSTPVRLSAVSGGQLIKQARSATRTASAGRYTLFVAFPQAGPEDRHGSRPSDLDLFLVLDAPVTWLC
jgi:hypothetical protein